MSQELLFILNDFPPPYENITVEIRYDRVTGAIIPVSTDSIPLGTPYPTNVGQVSTSYQECGAVGFPPTTLLRFRRIEIAPWAEKLPIENSPACEIVACDLLIEQPVSVTPANSFFTADGSITVTATSTYSGIEYSIDGENFQSSNVFSGLSTGEYTLYARDAKGCTYQVTAFVPVQAGVYGERFRSTYTDKQGDETRISIFKENYTGVTDTIKGTGTPLSIAINSRNDFAFKAVKSSAVEMNFITKIKYALIELYTDRWNENRVEIYKNGVLFHKSWVIASEYSENYNAPPYKIRATAADLGLLKKIDFEEIDGTAIRGKKTLLDIILICLNQLAFDLEVWENLNLYEENHDADPLTDSPLTQTYYDCEALEGKNCYEVLEVILTPFRARVFQYNATWHIQQVDLSTRSYVRRKYSSSGVFQSSETVDLETDTLDRTTDNIRWLNRSGRLDVEPAYQSFKVTQELLPDNYIAKGFESDDFIDENTLEGWTGTADILREQNEEGKYNLSILGNASSYVNATFIERRLPYIANIPDESAILVLKFSWFVDAPDAQDNNNNQLYFNLRFDNGILRNWLTVTESDGVFKGIFGGFLDPENRIEFKGSKANTWNNFELQIPIVSFANIANDADMILTLRQGVQTNYVINSIKYKELELFYLPKGVPPTEELNYESKNLPRRYIVSEAITVEAGDAVVENNARNTYKGAFTLADGTVTQNWRELGLQTTKPLIELLTEKRYQARETTKQRLSGMLTTRFPFTNYLTDPYAPGKAFLPVYVRIDDKQQYSDFEGIENPTNPPVCNSALPTNEMYLNNSGGFRMRWQKNGELYCWTTQKTV